VSRDTRPADSGCTACSMRREDKNRRFLLLRAHLCKLGHAACGAYGARGRYESARRL
jgi:hypothetical protein